MGKEEKDLKEIKIEETKLKDLEGSGIESIEKSEEEVELELEVFLLGPEKKLKDKARFG